MQNILSQLLTILSPTSEGEKAMKDDNIASGAEFLSVFDSLTMSEFEPHGAARPDSRGAPLSFGPVSESQHFSAPSVEYDREIGKNSGESASPTPKQHPLIETDVGVGAVLIQEIGDKPRASDFTHNKPIQSSPTILAEPPAEAIAAETHNTTQSEAIQLAGNSEAQGIASISPAAIATSVDQTASTSRENNAGPAVATQTAVSVPTTQNISIYAAQTPIHSIPSQVAPNSHPVTPAAAETPIASNPVFPRSVNSTSEPPQSPERQRDQSALSLPQNGRVATPDTKTTPDTKPAIIQAVDNPQSHIAPIAGANIVPQSETAPEIRHENTHAPTDPRALQSENKQASSDLQRGPKAPDISTIDKPLKHVLGAHRSTETAPENTRVNQRDQPFLKKFEPQKSDVIALTTRAATPSRAESAHTLDIAGTELSSTLEPRTDIETSRFESTLSSTTTPTREPALLRPELPRLVAQQLAQALPQEPNSPIELVLSPEELGRVRLTFVPSEQGMMLSIIAERPETLDMMRRNIETLAHGFQSLGYENATFNFAQSHSDGSSDRQDDAGAFDLRQKNEDSEHPAQPSHTPLRIIETDHVDYRV